MKDQKSSYGNKRKRPTLFDVDREVSVGTTTVSRVINGGHYAEADTMAHVQSIIADSAIVQARPRASRRTNIAATRLRRSLCCR